MPLSGTVLIAVSDRDKPEAVGIAKKYLDAGFKIFATPGTYEVLTKFNIPCENIGSGRPNINDLIINGQVQLIINTPREKAFTKNGTILRRGAVRARIPYITTLAAANAAIEGIITMKNTRASNSLKSLKEWHSLIK